MDLRARRAAVALAVLPLATGGLALLPGAVGGAASAACAPSITTTIAHAHAAKPKVHAAKPVVAKKGKRKYVATVALTVKQGTASIVLTESVCPDGADGAAATTSQTSSGAGVATHSVRAHAVTRKGATAAAKTKAHKLAAKLKKQGLTKKGRKKAEQRAVAAARPLALSKAHDALYRSDLAYLSENSSTDYTVSPTPPDGRLSPSLAQRPNGDLVLSVPAGYDPQASGAPSVCLRRAPAWPSAFAFDGGTATSPDLQALATSQSKDVAGVNGRVVTSTAPPQELPVGWSADWHADGSFTSSVFGGDQPAAGDMVCLTGYTAEPSTYTVTLRGATVGSNLVWTTERMEYKHVVGGFPVELR